MMYLEDRQSAAASAELASRSPIARIYFGHQSVGMNILNGVRALSPQTAIHALTREATHALAPGIHHTRIGQNRDPYSKIEDFHRDMMLMGHQLDFAMMKFCYVDIHSEVNVQRIFDRYRSAVSALRQRFPDLRFIHATVPLRELRNGVRSRLKLLMGQPLKNHDDNDRRNAYNDLVRSEPLNNDMLFDLARLESTRPDGSLYKMNYRGTAVPALYPEYTDDGGHLNSSGQRMVAAHLLKLLTEI